MQASGLAAHADAQAALPQAEERSRACTGVRATFCCWFVHHSREGKKSCSAEVNVLRLMYGHVLLEAKNRNEKKAEKGRKRKKKEEKKYCASIGEWLIHFACLSTNEIVNKKEAKKAKKQEKQEGRKKKRRRLKFFEEKGKERSVHEKTSPKSCKHGMYSPKRAALTAQRRPRESGRA